MDLVELQASLDSVWVMFAACFVFFIQAGFALVEAGFTRSKNTGNIIMKNLMDFSVGSLVYWLLGFALMFGAGAKRDAGRTYIYRHYMKAKLIEWEVFRTQVHQWDSSTFLFHKE